MPHQRVAKLIGLLGVMLVAGVVLVAQSQDRFTLRSANGIAFAEFRGYDAWQLIATSQPDGANGCGTSKVGCMKASPTLARGCHGCHSGFAKTRDFVFTEYAKR
jgi:hypothetical protein